MIHCPSCNRILMDSTTDGGVKLRSRMVLFHNGEAHALCPTCKTKVAVPLQLGSMPEAPPKTKHVLNMKNDR
jgi:hypothetical protein